MLPAPVRDPSGPLLSIVAATPATGTVTPEGYAVGRPGTLIQLDAARSRR